MSKVDTTILNGVELVAPTTIESQQAEATSRQLSTLLERQSQYDMQLIGTNDVLTIPASAMHVLVHVLAEMAQGNPVTFMPIHAEMTVSQAATFLNVSRPFLIKALENGDIPSRKLGSHYRIQFQHLMNYQWEMDQKRLDTLAELVEQAQELDMGY